MTFMSKFIILIKALLIYT